MLWIRLILGGAHIKYLNRPMVEYSESVDSIRSSKAKTNLKIIHAFFVEYGITAAPMVVKWIARRIFYVVFRLTFERRSEIAPS